MDGIREVERKKEEGTDRIREESHIINRGAGGEKKREKIERKG